MKLSWQAFSDWYNAKPLREQILVLVVVLSSIFSLWKMFLLNPLLVNESGMDSQLNDATKQVSDLNSKLTELKQTPKPSDEIRKKMAVVQQEIDHIDATIGNYTENLISPPEMAKALRSMLEETPGLLLISIKSEPGQKLVNTADSAAQLSVTGDIQLYRHGMLIEFEADYRNTFKYLTKLENLKWQLLWDSFHFVVKEHPKAHISIVVHTLSDKEAWIGA